MKGLFNYEVGKPEWDANALSYAVKVRVENKGDAERIELILEHWLRLPQVLLLLGRGETIGAKSLLRSILDV